MEIRAAALNDLEAVTALIARCSHEFILPGLSEEGVQTYLESHSLAKMKERMEQFDYHVLIANEKIVGVSGIRKPAHLVHLHIAPELHGQGWGRKLWLAARDAFLQKEKVSAFIVNASLFAHEFYRKLGFVGDAVETRDGVASIPMSVAL